MQQNYPNKAISNKDVAEPIVKAVEYNFPQYGITVEANSMEEAKAKLESKLKELNNK